MRNHWHTYILTMLNEHRNYVSGQIFTHVKKFVKQHGVDQFPTMEEIELIIKRDKILLPPADDASEEVKAQHIRIMFVAVWFVNCVLPQVAGASGAYREEVRK